MEEKEKNLPQPEGVAPQAEPGAAPELRPGPQGEVQPPSEAGATLPQTEGAQPFQAPPIHGYQPPQITGYQSPAIGPEPTPVPPPPTGSYALPPDPPPVQYPPQPQPRPERRRSLVGPLLLIVIGLVFLLNNMGLVNWSVWELLWRFWPVWLIAIGIDMLLGRRGRWGGLVALALVVTLLGGAFYYGGRFTGETEGAWRLGEPKSLNYPLNGAREARVEIESGVSRMRLQGGTAADRLIEGQVTPLDGERLEDDFSKSGATAHYTLSSRMRGVNLPVNAGWRQGEWDLRLNEQIPMALTLKTGVGQSEIDLSRMTITDLRITSGVGEMTVTMPSQGQVRGEIKAGVGQTTIRIPASIAARIRVQNGLGGVSVRGDFIREGSSYASPDYNTAAQRIDLTIEGGVGGIRIESVR